MPTTDQDVMLYGESRPSPSVVTGRAGPVTFEFTDLMLRHVRLGDVELARRIYFAVRGADWDVVRPIAVRDLRVDARARSFCASWTAHCRRHDADYTWSGSVKGSSDGTLTFQAAGKVLAAFTSPRIGLNVLLSADVCAGRMFELTGVPMPQGPIRYQEFPRLVPRTLVAASIESIRFCPRPGVDIAWQFAGSRADMEDQRNWAESTYKIFAALPHGYPDLQAGEAREQAVTLTFPRGRPPRARRPSADVRIRVGGPLPDRVFPQVGVDLDPEDGNLGGGEAKLLRAMGASHLRIRAADTERAIAAAGAVGCTVIAVVDDGGADAIAALGRLREAGVTISHVECVNLDAAMLASLRAAAPGVPVGGPAAPDFGYRPALRTAIDAGADFLSWGVEPNHHQDDDQTWLENAGGLAWQLATARDYRGDAGTLIGPVNFEPVYARQRPDPRQAGLLAAAYAAGVLKCMAEGGALAGTFFRAAGPFGVVHRTTGHALPAFDGDGSAQVYPVWHVLKLGAALRGRKVRAVATSDAVRVDAMAGADVVVLINKTATAQEVVLSGFRHAGRATVQAIDTASFEAIRHGADPRPVMVTPRRGRLALTAGPCAVLVVRPAAAG